MDEQHMRRAIVEGETGMAGGLGGPFGAVVVKDGVVVAAQHNRVVSDQDPTAHAEVLAIRQACRSLGTRALRGCEIYASCEPCPMCLGAIYWARLDRLYYAASREDAAAIGFDDAHIYSELDTPSQKRQLPAEQLLKDDARAMMQAWLSVPADRHY